MLSAAAPGFAQILRKPHADLASYEVMESWAKGPSSRVCERTCARTETPFCSKVELDVDTRSFGATRSGPHSTLLY